MADRASLEILGFIFGGVTVVVIAIAALVVHSNVGTNLAGVQGAPTVAVSLSAQRANR